MRREHVRVIFAMMVCSAMFACGQSADARARDAGARAQRQAAVRATPTVERVTVPADRGRVIYDPPPDLSASSPGRPGVAINGVDSSTRAPDSTRATAP